VEGDKEVARRDRGEVNELTFRFDIVGQSALASRTNERLMLVSILCC
jgi:hypothetical protein